MNKEIKAKWIEALRSGKYKQGTHWLRLQDTYCCLGVLCDLVDSSGWESNTIGTTHVYAREGYTHNYSKILPENIGQELDIPPEISDQLSNMNDDGHTFKEIADYIEARL